MVKLDEIFSLLSKERRRYALYCLDQHDYPVSVEELAAQITEWETNTDAADSTFDEKFNKIDLELRHSDLPKASNTPYIHYNAEEGLVELTGPPPEFEVFISIAKVIERPEQN